MNLNTLTALISVSLDEEHEPLIGTVPTLVNEALRQICQRRSFNCMKLTIPFTLNITGGAPFVYTLPATYKELQSGPHPLRNIGSPQAYLGSLWRIFTRQEAERMNITGMGLGERIAFMEQNTAGIWTVNFLGPIDMGYLPPLPNFEIDTYSFLADVALPTDENDLMRKYPMLVLEYTKWLIFSLKSDEETIRMKNESLRMINGNGSPEYPGLFNQASADDASRALRGRTSRMGGI